jgi:hypothetical protein
MSDNIFHSNLLNNNFTFDKMNILNYLNKYIYSKYSKTNNICHQINIFFTNNTDFDIMFCCSNIKLINNIKYVIYSYKTIYIENYNVVNEDQINSNIYIYDNIYNNDVIDYNSYSNDIIQHQILIYNMMDYIQQNIFNSIDILTNTNKRKLDDDDYNDTFHEIKKNKKE